MLAERVELPALSRGDRIYFLQTGAYSLEYASAFNGLSLPNVLFLRNGELLDGSLERADREQLFDDALPDVASAGSKGHSA